MGWCDSLDLQEANCKRLAEMTNLPERVVTERQFTYDLTLTSGG